MDIDEAHAKTKDQMHEFLADLKSTKEEGNELLERRQRELEHLDAKQESIRLSQLKMLEDLKDHIRVVRMGQDKLHRQIKETKAEYKLERAKYEKFLVRDKEKLMYANDMLSTRRMVLKSYENERKRVIAQLEKDKKLEAEKLAAEEGDADLRR